MAKTGKTGSKIVARVNAARAQAFQRNVRVNVIHHKSGLSDNFEFALPPDRPVGTDADDQENEDFWTACGIASDHFRNNYGETYLEEDLECSVYTL